MSAHGQDCLKVGARGGKAGEPRSAQGPDVDRDSPQVLQFGVYPVLECHFCFVVRVEDVLVGAVPCQSAETEKNICHLGGSGYCQGVDTLRFCCLCICHLKTEFLLANSDDLRRLDIQ